MSNLKFIRPLAQSFLTRLHEPRQFLQVIFGPRQVGKTTLITQVSSKLKQAVHFASADETGLRQREWITAQWTIARLMAESARKKGACLVLDEIQKIPQWEEVVKRLWDEDTKNNCPLKVVLLGSSPLLIGSGLRESLAGRFEVFYIPHWGFSEMKKAFGWTIDQYLFYGAYPGAANLIKQPVRWSRYICDSLIETTVSRDVLLMSRVDKPALLRRLFDLSVAYSGQILSWTKMIGQLQDAGNTTTLAHYLHLLEGAGMVAGLQKYAGSEARKRGSSPKLQVFNTALMTASSGYTLSSALADREFWGRLVESAVGAYLINGQRQGCYEVFYWRHKNQEVDFVIRRNRKLTAIEVKSQKTSSGFSGLTAFSSLFSPANTLIIGDQGIPIEKFLLKPPEYWLA